MKRILEAELLKTAIEIGEEILAKATIYSHGIFWRTVQSITPIGDLETEVNESIDTGVSGILNSVCKRSSFPFRVSIFTKS